MVKVFVHGVPETSAIWRPLLEELARGGVDDTVCLSPPGFGVPPPEGWLPSPPNYRTWLIAELERLKAQGAARVDLVGHDWGTGHVLGVVAERPDLIHTWATDCGGLVHPDYVWHDDAQTWQTSGEGEEAFAAMLELPKDFLGEVFQGLGMTPDVALEIARAVDQSMVDCILPLYRAALPPMLADLGQHLADNAPKGGLILTAADDSYAGTPEMAKEMADRFGAEHRLLRNVAHWWMCQDPATAADHLIEHWRRWP